MENVILTISRQFASGGRLVGQKLSELLEIPFYDKDIITIAAEKSGLSPDFIRSNEDSAKSKFLTASSAGLQMGEGAFFTHYQMPAADRAFYAQSAVIEELADKGSCVILGRCAGYLLRERPNHVSIFLYSTLDDRIERAVKLYGLEPKGLADKLVKLDKARANYHKYYTGESWKESHNFDLCLNTAKCGVDGAVDAILAYIGKK